MIYNKEDAQMTRGLAIICMVVLHLFCRQGSDVFGTPLIWLNATTPLVFLFGFFAEICVPLYSICAGYAQELLREKDKARFELRLKRVFRLMVNYWIILVVFTILALIFDPSGAIPGSFSVFLRSVFLLHSYNGAWWYLNTYILLVLLPPKVVLLPVRKLKLVPGLILCLLCHILWYLVNRADVIPQVPDSMPVLALIRKEFVNLAGILPAVWCGGLLCKFRAVERLSAGLNEKFSPGLQKWLFLTTSVLLFVGANVIHKAVLMGPVAVVAFLLFNLWSKPKSVRNVMLFFGKHSTNIWLVHMFFYAYVFEGLVIHAKYPIFIFAFMMLLCIAASYVIMLIERRLNGLIYHENKNHYLP